MGSSVATVTFFLTDIEGSTLLWQREPQAMSEALARHDALIAEAVASHQGRLVKSRGEGDSTFSVFDRPTGALAAAAAVQAAVAAEEWPEGVDLRVRAAVHTGEVEMRDGDFYGLVVNRCARMRSAAHGGQTVCSAATAGLCFDHLPPGVSLRSLGTHRLQDLDRAEPVFQVCQSDLDERFPPLKSMEGSPRNLPPRRTAFIGREDDLARMTKHLDTARLVTITGVGGCGKTRLALEVALQAVTHFPDGISWAELAPVSDPTNVAVAVAAALGSALLAGDPLDQLIELVDQRTSLIVLDNCEHVIDAVAELVDRLLDGCPNLKILTTSREPLEVEGEQVHQVRSLTLPDGAMVGEPCESVQLFCERALAVQEHFTSDAGVLADVEEICQHLDGMPLAIELAAAQVAHLSPRQIADRLDARLTLLTGGRRRVQRQQTLATALDWSHDLLGDAERELFRRLAVFTDRFGLEAAEAVCSPGAREAVVSTLHKLVAKSLVISDGGAGVHYRMLETVRMYAEHQLLAAGEGEEFRDRHRDHYLAWLEALPSDEILYGDGGLLQEQHNIRAAIRWSEAQDRPDLVARMASQLSLVWDLVDCPEAIRWLEMGVEALDKLNVETRERVLVARAFISVAALEEGFSDQSGSCIEAALALGPDRPGLWRATAYALQTLGEGSRFLEALASGNYAANAIENVEEFGRRALESADSSAARAFALLWLGHGRAAVGDIKGAIAVTDECRSCAEGRMAWLPYVDVTRSFLYHLDGQFDLAREAAEAAQAATAPEVEALRNTTELYALLALPLARAVDGAHEDALALMERSLSVARGSPVGGVLTAAVIVLAAMAALREDWARSAVLQGAAQAAFDRKMVRSTVDVVLYIKYLLQVQQALGNRCAELQDRGAGMELSEALHFGLDRAWSRG